MSFPAISYPCILGLWMYESVYRLYGHRALRCENAGAVLYSSTFQSLGYITYGMLRWIFYEEVDMIHILHYTWCLDIHM